ncbi:ABC transporter permease [Pararhodobacter sp.]|uniref:ABC transporter permease n=1 Tax=Pararhodobacter sp. TaxID=2127056 RepID=UPI002FDC89E3
MTLSQKWTVLPALVLALVMFAVPVALVLREALFDPNWTLVHFERFFGRPVFQAVFRNTLMVAGIVATGCLLIGYPMALYIVTRPARWRPLLLFLVLVPMWMSILVRTYAWMVVLGREGVINSAFMALGLIEAPLQMLYTSGAVYVAMVQILLPIMVVTCYSAMTEIDLGLIRAARVCGAGPVRAFRHVFLPLSLEGALTGWSVIFILSLGFFIVPALLGGRQDALLGNMIVTQVAQTNWGFAAAMAIVLLGATIALLAFMRLLAARFIHSPREGGV